MNETTKPGNDSLKPKLLWSSLSRIGYISVPIELERELQNAFTTVDIVIARDEATFDQHISSCEILVSWTLHGRNYSDFKRLRWIHSPSAGVNALMIPELIGSDVVLTNGRTVHAIPVAEHSIALLLALARNFAEDFAYQHKGMWGHRALWMEKRLPIEINGKTLGLIGLGSIGGEIATRARALGMRVVAVKRDLSRGAELADQLFALRDLRSMLEIADFIVIAAPDTAETRHLIGESDLQSMKDVAFLINVARGSLVDTSALIQALESGKLAGAGLDVTEPEPLPEGHPLWTAPNVFITHHMASTTERRWERHALLIRENLGRYLTGRPLLNLVDKSRGY